MDNRLDGLKQIFRAMLGFAGEHRNPFLTTPSLGNVAGN